MSDSLTGIMRRLTALENAYEQTRTKEVPQGFNVGTAFPSSPATGARFYRSDQNRLYVYTGSVWMPIAGTAIGCRAYNSANISITTATVTALTFDTERYDTDGLHSTASNTSRLIAPFAGYYQATGSLLYAANAAGQRIAAIRLNGTTNIALQSAPVNAAGPTPGLVVSAIYFLALNDYVELTTYQDSGGNLNVLNAANYSPEFALHFLGG